jgi:hypothetical protein
MGDPMDAPVEDDEKEGLKLVGNLVCLSWIGELCGRDELPCALGSHHQQLVRQRKAKLDAHSTHRLPRAPFLSKSCQVEVD